MRRPFSLVEMAGGVRHRRAMTDLKPWFASEANGNPDGRRYAPATARNRDAILAVLRDELPETGTVLEIASGTGEHAVFFAAALPSVTWQPSDREPSALESIRAWIAADDPSLPNIAPPVLLDVSAIEWPIANANAIFVANLTHIAPWSATEGLFNGAATILSANGVLILYGPFFRQGHTPGEGDLAFNRNLRDRDPALGLRQVEDIVALAATQGIRLCRTHAMPADNLTLIFHKD